MRRTPAIPAAISTMSDTVHSATTGSTCSRWIPCRSTNAFCAPIAAISVKQARKPTTSGEFTQSTLGSLYGSV